MVFPSISSPAASAAGIVKSSDLVANWGAFGSTAGAFCPRAVGAESSR